MSHSYAQNQIHLVFSSKNREKLLARNFLPRLWAYTAAICKNHNLLTFAVGGLGITSIRFSVRPSARVTAQSFQFLPCTTTIPASPTPKPTQNAGLATRNSTTKINTITATILA